MSENENLIEEIKQISVQYRSEVGRSRKAWPKSVRDRISKLFAGGVKAVEISRKTEIPYYTVLRFRPAKLRVSRARKETTSDQFRELAVIDVPVESKKVATVTVPTVDNQKVVTVTVTTPDGYQVRVDNSSAAIELIRQLRKDKE